MNVRRPLAVVSLASVALAACGDDGTSAPATHSPDTAAPTDTESPTDTPASETSTDGSSGDDYAHPAGADEVIVSVAELGGFLPARYSFSASPRLIITGDGSAYTPAVTTAEFPGPLVPPMQVQTISEEGIQEVLAAADDAGLFAEVDYGDETTELVADASTTVVTISVDGATWTHSAYALGIEPPPDSPEAPSRERQTLKDFVAEVSGLVDLVGEDALGDPESLQPDTFELMAMPVEDPSGLAVDDIEPTVAEWPSDAGLALAEAGACTRLAADGVGELLESSNELTLFEEDDVVYDVWVRPALPGRTCET